MTAENAVMITGRNRMLYADYPLARRRYRDGNADGRRRAFRPAEISEGGRRCRGCVPDIGTLRNAILEE